MNLTITKYPIIKSTPSLYRKALYFLLIVMSPLFIITELNAQNYFSEVSSFVGLNGTFGLGDYGGGVSFIDFNNDGWDDLTFATESGKHILFYENNNGTGFTALPSLVLDTSFHKQVLWVDIDNDADFDFSFASARSYDRLYENKGNLDLQEISTSAGLHANDGNSFGVCASDIDNDGLLDLYYTIRNVSRSYLFHNQGDNTFEDITLASNAYSINSGSNCSSFIDYNKDGLPDLYTVVDKAKGNILFENNGDLTFSDVSDTTNTDVKLAGMNVGYGDINNDGHLDIYITDTPVRDGNVLLLNNGDETFTDISVSSGTNFDSFCWAGSFADFNNDGYLDLYVTSQLAAVEHNNKIYINNKDLTFTELYDPFLSNMIIASYAAAIGDYDNDGKLDIAVCLGDYKNFMLLKNEFETPNNYIKIDLEGTVSNRSAIGTWLELYTDTLTQYRYTHSGISYIGQDSDKIHFGLAEHTIIDSLIVKWPSGNINKLYDIAPNQLIYILETSSSNDLDGDGFPTAEDCDDNNPSIHPAATEIANNEIDEDCDGVALIIDEDQDGFNSDEDCDDNDPDINPDATEIVNNEIDEDCDGEALIIDEDQDGFNSDEDCDDNDPDINPDATEIANNEIDEDCDDEVLIIDEDEDGFNSDLDCNDEDPNIYPGAIEIVNNGIDEDCNGVDSLMTTNISILDENIDIFPNPLTNELQINWANNATLVNLKVVDILGIQHISQNFKGESIKVDFSKLPSGVYYIKLKDPSSHIEYTHKVIKQNP